MPRLRKPLQETSGNHELLAAKRFSHYAPEQIETIREAKKSPDRHTAAGKALKIFERWSDENLVVSEDVWDDFKSAETYRTAQHMLRKSKVSLDSEEIQAFTLRLADFGEMKGGRNTYGAAMGFFLSALIETGKDAHVILNAGHLEGLEYVGFRNRKMLDIQGDGIGHLGCEMSCGSIVLSGNAGDYAGERMCGGLLRINGNADGFLGDSMEKGEIILEGSASIEAGAEMKGGKIRIMGDTEEDVGLCQSVPERYPAHPPEIHVEGKRPSLAKRGELLYGRVYHKGQLISDNLYALRGRIKLKACVKGAIESGCDAVVEALMDKIELQDGNVYLNLGPAESAGQKKSRK